jgi:3-hydroxyanthranilate 3,4-dioxygenase
MEYERTKLGSLFAAAGQAGPYGELPVPPADFDPQVLVSRNDRVQPFFLVCERDTVVATLAGEGSIEFLDAPVLEQRVGPGDFVYVPAGTPHRIRPTSPLVQYRYKAQHAGLEGVAWYCDGCGAELWRREFDTERTVPQRGYLEACEEFNGKQELRTCASCGAVHDPADVSGTRWAEIASLLEAEQVAT